MNELLVHDLVNAERAELPADAGPLGPAERQLGAATLDAVDPDHADLELVGNARGQRPNSSSLNARISGVTGSLRRPGQRPAARLGGYASF